MKITKAAAVPIPTASATRFEKYARKAKPTIEANPAISALELATTGIFISRRWICHAVTPAPIRRPQIISTLTCMHTAHNTEANTSTPKARNGAYFSDAVISSLRVLAFPRLRKLLTSNIRHVTVTHGRTVAAKLHTFLYLPPYLPPGSGYKKFPFQRTGRGI